jgi:hypothetical protein
MNVGPERLPFRSDVVFRWNDGRRGRRKNKHRSCRQFQANIDVAATVNGTSHVKQLASTQLEKT